MSDPNIDIQPARQSRHSRAKPAEDHEPGEYHGSPEYHAPGEQNEPGERYESGGHHDPAGHQQHHEPEQDDAVDQQFDDDSYYVISNFYSEMKKRHLPDIQHGIRERRFQTVKSFIDTESFLDSYEQHWAIMTGSIATYQRRKRSFPPGTAMLVDPAAAVDKWSLEGVVDVHGPPRPFHSYLRKAWFPKFIRQAEQLVECLETAEVGIGVHRLHDLFPGDDDEWNRTKEIWTMTREEINAVLRLWREMHMRAAQDLGSIRAYWKRKVGRLEKFIERRERNFALPASSGLQGGIMGRRQGSTVYWAGDLSPSRKRGLPPGWKGWRDHYKKQRIDTESLKDWVSEGAIQELAVPPPQEEQPLDDDELVLRWVDVEVDRTLKKRKKENMGSGRPEKMPRISVAPKPERWREYDLAQTDYASRFPNSSVEIETSGSYVERGLKALIESLKAQLPDVPVPEDADLAAILVDSWDLIPCDPSLEWEDRYTPENFQAEELAVVLERWGQRHRERLQLGCYQSFTPGIIRPGKRGSARTVWINAKLSSFGSTGVPKYRWSGLRAKEPLLPGPEAGGEESPGGQVPGLQPQPLPAITPGAHVTGLNAIGLDTIDLDAILAQINQPSQNIGGGFVSSTAANASKRMTNTKATQTTNSSSHTTPNSLPPLANPPTEPALDLDRVLALALPPSPPTFKHHYDHLLSQVATHIQARSLPSDSVAAQAAVLHPKAVVLREIARTWLATEAHRERHDWLRAHGDDGRAVLDLRRDEAALAARLGLYTDELVRRQEGGGDDNGAGEDEDDRRTHAEWVRTAATARLEGLVSELEGQMRAKGARIVEVARLERAMAVRDGDGPRTCLGYGSFLEAREAAFGVCGVAETLESLKLFADMCAEDGDPERAVFDGYGLEWVREGEEEEEEGGGDDDEEEEEEEVEEGEFDAGYAAGYSLGYGKGCEDGAREAHVQGFKLGRTEGYQVGFEAGSRNRGREEEAEAADEDSQGDEWSEGEEDSQGDEWTEGEEEESEEESEEE